MFKLFPLRVLFYQLYLLQLEEYSVPRYLKLIAKTKGVAQSSTRKGIDWTKKLLLVFLLALLFQSAVAFGLLTLITSHVTFSSNVVYILLAVIFLILCYLFFIFLLISLLILTPLDLHLKKKIITQAKEKMKEFPHLKIIGIAGSYGKTTMKELVGSILSQKYNVLQTPKSINTPLGISRLILKRITPQTEIFIVEMGEHYRGDIKELCNITKPDISIVTGINEAHLERMGTINNTIASIFEVVESTKPAGTILLNADDKLVMENYGKYIQKQEVILYGTGVEVKNMQIKDIKFHEDASGISFTMIQRGLDIGTFKVALLGEYIIGNLVGAIQLAQKLQLSVNEIVKGITLMKPVEHRLQPIYNKHTKVLVIDDSYNGNPKGVTEAIKVLSRFDQNRKIYLTPGLVESGAKAEQVHYDIGKQLAPVAGLVILIKNSVTPFIAKGLEENGFDKEKIVWFDTAKEAHKSLGKILRAYDVILFQNDWPDNYY